MKLSEFFVRYARGRGVTVGRRFASNLRRKVGLQASTRLTRSGRLVAAHRAIPFAPPRRVTGNLQRSVKLRETAWGLMVTVHAPYATPLEKSMKWYGWPHAFVSIVAKEMGLKVRS